MAKWNETISFTKSLSLKMSSMALLSALRIGLGNPPIILGFIPAYRTKHFEVSRSQEVTEFRAIGAAFLGQQKGGNLGIRIDCEFDQSEMLMVLAILYLLEMGRGEEQKYNIEEDPLNKVTKKVSLTQTIKANSKKKLLCDARNYALDNNTFFTSVRDKGISEALFGGFKSMTSSTSLAWPVGNPEAVSWMAGVIQHPKAGKWLQELTEMGPVTASNIIPVEDEKALNYQSALYGRKITDANYIQKDGTDISKTVTHRTFPLITQNEIIFDCFVETVMFKKSAKDGKNIISLSILCRQYQPTEYPKSSKLVVGENKSISKELYSNNHYKIESKNTAKLQQVVALAPTVAKASGFLGKLLDRVDLNKGSLGVDWIVNSAYRLGVFAFRRNKDDVQLRRRNIRNMGVYGYLLDTYNQNIQKSQTTDISHLLFKKVD